MKMSIVMIEDDVSSYCKDIIVAMQEDHALARRVNTMREQRAPGARMGMDEINLRWEAGEAHRRTSDLQMRAAAAFARLNGWSHSRSSFSEGMLARNSSQSKRWEMPCPQTLELFDHAAYFRETRAPYRPVAMVGQPYNTDPVRAGRIAGHHGLEVHAPPVVTASWWLPGSTAFFCCTRPGTPVAFLPDQLTWVAEMTS
jgi:hypothetical protein